MRTRQRLSRTGLGGGSSVDRGEAVRSSDASTEDPTHVPCGERDVAGESVPATTESAPSQRAVVRVDGVSAYRGPADIALFYFGRWSAEHPEKNVTISEEEA